MKYRDEVLGESFPIRELFDFIVLKLFRAKFSGTDDADGPFLHDLTPQILFKTRTANIMLGEMRRLRKISQTNLIKANLTILRQFN
jgi:hypothetical protein